MGRLSYRDFLLEAGALEHRDGVLSAFTVRTAATEERVEVPLWLCEEVRYLRRGDLDKDEQSVRKIGGAMADLLLPPTVRQLFDRAFADARRHKRGLRIRLRFPGELADLPWEYIHLGAADGGHGPGLLALDPIFSIVRDETAVGGDKESANQGDEGARIRIVVAMASPRHSSKLKLIHLADDYWNLNRIFATRDDLDPRFEPSHSIGAEDDPPGASLKDLTDALLRGASVIHLGGHGIVEEPLPPSLPRDAKILLDSGRNHDVWHTENSIVEAIRGRGARLVVLSACATGRRTEPEGRGGIAAALVGAGVPAVVAMNGDIRDRLAAPFVEALYSALVNGDTIDEAVALGRKSIRAQAATDRTAARTDWGVPVLYTLSSYDGWCVPPARREVAGWAPFWRVAVTWAAWLLDVVVTPLARRQRLQKRAGERRWSRLWRATVASARGYYGKRLLEEARFQLRLPVWKMSQPVDALFVRPALEVEAEGDATAAADASRGALDELVRDHRICIVTGELGLGKTTSLLHLQSAIAGDRSEALAGMVPIFLRISELPSGIPDLRIQARLAVQQIIGLRLGTLLADAALADGRAVLMLDGLDEVGPRSGGRTLSSRRANTVRAIRDFCDQRGAASANRVVVTCRQSGLDPAELSDIGPLIVRLRPFSREQGRKFMAMLAKVSRQTIGGAGPGQELAGNPLMLSLHAQLSSGLGEHVGSVTRTELYQRIIGEIFDNRPAVASRHIEFHHGQEKRRLLAQMAYAILIAGMPGNFGDLGLEDIRAMDGHRILRRDAPLVEVRALADELVHEHGVLRPTADGRYAFTIRSYAEYFAACELVEQVRQGRVEDAGRLFQERTDLDEVMRFYCGLSPPDAMSSLVLTLADAGDWLRTGACLLDAPADAGSELPRRVVSGLVDLACGDGEEAQRTLRLLVDLAQRPGDMRRQALDACRMVFLARVSGGTSAPEDAAWLRSLFDVERETAIELCGATLRSADPGWNRIGARLLVEQLAASKPSDETPDLVPLAIELWRALRDPSHHAHDHIAEELASMLQTHAEGLAALSRIANDDVPGSNAWPLPDLVDGKIAVALVNALAGVRKRGTLAITNAGLAQAVDCYRGGGGAEKVFEAPWSGIGRARSRFRVIGFAGDIIGIAGLGLSLAAMVLVCAVGIWSSARGAPALIQTTALRIDWAPTDTIPRMRQAFDRLESEAKDEFDPPAQQALYRLKRFQDDPFQLALPANLDALAKIDRETRDDVLRSFRLLSEQLPRPVNRFSIPIKNDQGIVSLFGGLIAVVGLLGSVLALRDWIATARNFPIRANFLGNTAFPLFFGIAMMGVVLETSGPLPHLSGVGLVLPGLILGCGGAFVFWCGKLSDLQISWIEALTPRGPSKDNMLKDGRGSPDPKPATAHRQA